MNVDMGLSAGRRRKYWDKAIPMGERMEFAIFALTPGMPTEWVLAWCKIRNWFCVDKARWIVRTLRHQAEPLAIENAASITVEDGWRMVLMAPKPYVGAYPHWASLALQHRCAEKGLTAVARELGTHRSWVVRHRKSAFCPLTLRRTRQRGGTPVYGLPWEFNDQVT